MLILMNNSWIEKNKARVDIFSDAVMYGFGLFETFRTFKNKTLFRLDYHIERLLSASDRLGLTVNYSAAQIADMVVRVVSQSNLELQRLKILAFSDHLLISSDRLVFDNSIYNGISLLPVHLQRAFPELKSTSYLDCLHSYEKANSAGFYDALLLDDSGTVSEGSRCNIFWVNGDTVLTREKKVLPGIVRRVVIEELPVKTGFCDIDLDSLLGADEVFITNSVIGIVPVTRIANTSLSAGRTGPMTLTVMGQYRQLLQGAVNGS